MLIFALPLVILPSLFLTMALLRRCDARGALWAGLVGVGMALVFLGVAAATGWLNGTAYQDTSCTDGCWELPSKRELTGFVVGSSLALWLVGVGIGAVVSYVVLARRRRRSDVT